MLRERREDIPMLAHHFLQTVCAENERMVRGFAPETMAFLVQYAWPGNVRELENVVERAVSLTHGPLILPEDLPEEIRRAEASPAIPILQHDREHITLDELEKRYLIKVLKDTGNNKVRAAKILGIDRRTLYRMAERFGIELGEEGESP